MSDSATMNQQVESQELNFQAEVQQVLHLMVHSLYTNREVFLRELIANASDALDKARFASLTNHDVASRLAAPEIRISFDKDRKLLTIEDTGIGMTRQEAIDHLGTIARSGTLEFLKKLKQEGSSDSQTLIGQFGVGFYSAFIVADRVDVESKSAIDPDAPGVIWRSDGKGSFTVSRSDRSAPGTKVELHLNSENEDLLSDYRIEVLVKKYSDFVSHPIRMGEKTLNQTSALWARSKSEIDDAQYDEFYRHLVGGFGKDTPLARLHMSADAPIQFHALLFVPSKAPFDLLSEGHKKGIRLYAKRVFVMDDCEKLVPPYLGFLRGVVDSEDLSLNVSREMLQDNRTLEQIQKQIVKQALKTIEELAETKPDDYRIFWDEFGRLFRLGVSSDASHRESIAKLLRYPSTKTDEGQFTSLNSYVAKMPEGQKAIYYLTGANLKALQHSPLLELFRKKNVEVLLMADPIDEWVVGSLTSFGDKPLESIAHGSIDLSSIKDPEDQQKPQDEETKPSPQFESCIQAIKKVLGDRVKDVRLSKRLTDSPSCMITEEGELSANMERVMRMLDKDVKPQPRVLELNPEHPIVKNLSALIEQQPESPDVVTFSELLLDQAMLAEGVVPDPTTFIKRMQALMTLASGAKLKDQAS
jgi:molecular chaperone HtpG